MTNDQIIAHLEQKLDLLMLAFPEEQRARLRSDLYFAGGCVVDLVLDDTPRDYDMFFKTEDAVNIVKEMAALDSFIGYLGMDIAANTENAVTLKFSDGTVFQLVTRFFGTTERVFKSFDYEMCKSFYDPHTKELAYNEHIIKNKILHYDGTKDEYTLNTLKRLCKFVSRGWTPDNTTIVNLYKAIQKRPPLEEPSEKRSQSVGFYGSSFN